EDELGCMRGTCVSEGGGEPAEGVIASSAGSRCLSPCEDSSSLLVRLSSPLPERGGRPVILLEARLRPDHRLLRRELVLHLHPRQGSRHGILLLCLQFPDGGGRKLLPALVGRVLGARYLDVDGARGGVQARRRL